MDHIPSYFPPIQKSSGLLQVGFRGSCSMIATNVIKTEENGYYEFLAAVCKKQEYVFTLFDEESDVLRY